MGKLLIILCDTPFQSERVDHALRVAEAAIERGHNVSFYLLMDGIYNLIMSQSGEAFRLIPISRRFKELMLKGVKVTCCKLCMDLRGIEKTLIPEGAVAGKISDLSEEISEADSVLSFTGET